MKRRGTIIRPGIYGAADNYDEIADASSDSYAGSDMFDGDGEDAKPWKAERIPLLTRMQSEARSFGAKRMLSMERTISVETLIEHDSPTQDWRWQRKLKVAILTLVCIAMTVFLLFLPEAMVSSSIVTVGRNEPVTFDLDQTYNGQMRSSDKIVRVILRGSFVSPEFNLLVSDHLIVTAHEENTSFLNFTVNPVPWIIGLVPPEYVGTSEQSVVSHLFDLEEMNLNSDNSTLTISTTSRAPVAISVSVSLVSTLADIDIILGAIILILMYILIIFEVAHRTVISMLSATAAIAVLAVLDERPAMEEIITWIDIETVVLLFSMMIMVSILSETGVFNYLGFWSFKVTKGRVWPLLTLLCALTAVISSVLDNVTTILLMTPVIIQLCEAISVDPVKVLMANVIFSNIGGAATAIGDPPNVLIANDPDIQAAGVNFGTFTLHMVFAVIAVALVCFGQLRFMYRKLLASSEDDRELNDLKHEIMIWHRSAHSLPNMTREEAMVKSAIEAKIQELREELEEKERAVEGRRQPRRTEPVNLGEMEASCQITDRPLLIKSVCVLAVTIALFFMQNFPQFQLSLGWTSLLGALTLLVLSDKLEVESVFSRVEWSTLVFFACLFVVMEALNKLNLLNWIGSGVEGVIKSVSPAYQLTVAIVLILWVSGLASAFIDNIPFTTMMIPIIVSLSESTEVDLPLQPLVWSLALGACLGGNGTLIGASANVVCAGVAEQHGYKFTFKEFFLVGMPITIVSLVIANIYLLICHVAFEWNGV